MDAWAKPQELPEPGADPEAALTEQPPADPEVEELEDEAAPPAATPAPVATAPQPAAGPKLLPLAGQAVSRGQQQQQSGSSSVQRTRSAMPEQVAMAAQQATSDAYDNAIKTADDARFDAAAASSARAAQVEQKGRELEAAASAGMAQQQARKAQTIQKIGEVSARKTDNAKIWKDKGVLGTAFGLLGVIMGGVKSGMLGGPNTAMESLQEQKRLNIQSQMADRDSELRGLERELGSIEAALPVFEARMNDALKQRAEALLIDEKSVSGLANGRQFIAQLELQKQDSLKRGAEAYYGTLASSEAQSTAVSTTDEYKEQRAQPKPTGGAMSDAQYVAAAKAARDKAWLDRHGLTHDEAQKELADYRQRAVKQNEFQGSIDATAQALGLTVTKNKDGTVTVSGEPKAGVRPLGIDAVSDEQARKVDRAYNRLRRADVMGMLREPSAALQDEFASIVERPFYDDEIVGQLQELYDLSTRVQSELDGGYNPGIPDIYEQAVGTPQPPGGLTNLQGQRVTR